MNNCLSAWVLTKVPLPRRSVNEEFPKGKERLLSRFTTDTDYFPASLIHLLVEGISRLRVPMFVMADKNVTIPPRPLQRLDIVVPNFHGENASNAKA